MKRLQFSLSTLFIAVTLAAIVAFLWSRFVTPNITGVALDGGDIVFHIADDAAQKLFPDAPYYHALPGDSNADFHHNTYVSVPFDVAATAIAIVIALMFAAGVAWTKLAKRWAKATACQS